MPVEVLAERRYVRSDDPGLMLLLGQAVLVLCRGLFTPVNDVIESNLQHHVYTAAFTPGEAAGGSGGGSGYPLADAFAEVGQLLAFPLSPPATMIGGLPPFFFHFFFPSFFLFPTSIIGGLPPFSLLR